jgi:uncharacterized protein (TIGR02266 family)
MERRSSPRINKVIEIQYMSNSPRLTARITDISEGGIFINAINTLPEGTLVKFKFFLTGTPTEKAIEGEGKVIWSHSDIVGMGIEFQNLSGENRNRILDYVRTIRYVEGRK